MVAPKSTITDENQPLGLGRGEEGWDARVLPLVVQNNEPCSR